MVPDGKAFVQGLCEALREYLRGHPARALSKLLDSLALAAAIETLMVEHVPSDLFAALYRARQFPDVPHNTARDMFHIPVDKRHLVETQRFSIPGFPCLYLGSTSLVCWNELGRPPLEHFVAVRMEVASTLPVRVLNLGLPPSALKRKLEAYPRMVDPTAAWARYVLLWPLIAGCSVPVKHRQASFKPEYILPQLMLQWLTSHSDVVALGYTSNRLTATSCATISQNWVFPPLSDEVDSFGHFHDLVDRFRVTEPLPWALRHAVNKRPRLVPLVGNQSFESVALSGNVATPYAQTSFFEFDSFLMAERATVV